MKAWWTPYCIGNLIFYNGDKFPQWKGDLIMGNMTRSVLRATFDVQGNPTGQERMLAELKQRIRDTREGPDGYIYLLTDETFGALLRMEPGK
jgi:glucose/arabinose dehydrogenase